MRFHSKERGKKAENRVIAVATSMGLKVRHATAKEDCGGQKTDVYIVDIPVQVSCQKKSIRQRKSLACKGISSICAGEDVNEADLRRQIIGIFSKSK